LHSSGRPNRSKNSSPGRPSFGGGVNLSLVMLVRNTQQTDGVKMAVLPCSGPRTHRCGRCQTQPGTDHARCLYLAERHTSTYHRVVARKCCACRTAAAGHLRRAIASIAAVTTGSACGHVLRAQSFRLPAVSARTSTRAARPRCSVLAHRVTCTAPASSTGRRALYTSLRLVPSCRASCKAVHSPPSAISDIRRGASPPPRGNSGSTTGGIHVATGCDCLCRAAGGYIERSRSRCDPQRAR
jgi:hypothetical protein